MSQVIGVRIQHYLRLQYKEKGQLQQARQQILQTVRKVRQKVSYERSLVVLLPETYTHQSTDTSHVPCRFYPLGQCQAGNTCAFKHTTERMDAQCRYFLKVKFGNSSKEAFMSLTHDKGELQIRCKMCSSTRPSQWSDSEYPQQ